MNRRIHLGAPVCGKTDGPQTYRQKLRKETEHGWKHTFPSPVSHGWFVVYQEFGLWQVFPLVTEYFVIIYWSLPHTASTKWAVKMWTEVILYADGEKGSPITPQYKLDSPFSDWAVGKIMMMKMVNCDSKTTELKDSRQDAQDWPSPSNNASKGTPGWQAFTKNAMWFAQRSVYLTEFRTEVLQSSTWRNRIKPEYTRIWVVAAYVWFMSELWSCIHIIGGLYTGPLCGD